MRRSMDEGSGMRGSMLSLCTMLVLISTTSKCSDHLS